MAAVCGTGPSSANVAAASFGVSLGCSRLAARSTHAPFATSPEGEKQFKNIYI